MADDHYEVGDTVVLTVALSDPTNDATTLDADSVSLDVRAPNGTVTTVPAAGTGTARVYTARLPVDQSGTYFVEATSTGDLAGVGTARFYVNPSKVHAS